MSVVDELVTILGLKTDPKAESTASGFGKILGGVTAAAAAVGAALVAAAGAVGAYAVQQAEAIDQAGKMADAFGISFEAFQELEFAAQKSGAEVEEFRTDLENLSKTLDDNDALKELGVNAKDATGKLRSTDEVLMDIAKKFETLSKGEQNKFTDQLGLSPSALKVLQQGGKGLEQLRGEAQRLGLVLDSNAKDKAARFQSSLLNARSVVDALGKSISVGLLPGMADALDVFTDWIGANREFISAAVTQVVEGVAQGFRMFGAAVGYVYDQIISFIGPIDGLVEGLDATQAIAITVAIALGALAVATIAATWPYILMAAAIGAIILVLDDLYSAFTGGESIIGGWVESFMEAYPGITAGIGTIIDWIGQLMELVGGGLVAAFTTAAGIIGDVFTAIIDTVKNVMSAIEAVISGANPFAVLSELFTKQFDTIFELAKSYAGKIGDFIGGVFGSAPSSAPVAPEVMSSAGGGGTSNSTTTININGAGDPAAVGNEVVRKGGLGSSLQQTSPGLSGPVTA